jgi:hypothetical protein
MKRQFGYELALKVSDALRAKRDAIESKGMTLPQVTKMVSAGLGREVPESTVRIVSKAVGVTFPRGRPIQPTSGKWVIVAKAVVNLYERLGEKLPDDLAELMSKVE